MNTRLAHSLLLLAILVSFSGCTQQFEVKDDGEASTTFRPMQKAQSKARAEEFLRAYAPLRWQEFPLQKITRRADSPGSAYWVVLYSGKDIHTSINVEIEEGTGKGRIRGFLGNVLLVDNPTASGASATNQFRTLEDFRALLAAQAATFKPAPAPGQPAATPPAAPPRR